MKRWIPYVTALLLSAAGCTPMTFSNEGAIDFEQYRSVYVTASAPNTLWTSDGDRYSGQYLARELRASSGFSSVTLDPNVPVDLVLSVAVSIHMRFDSDDNETFDAHAVYEARTPNGELVDSGEEEDSSNYEHEALEDVLDEVALRYLKRYRL